MPNSRRDSNIQRGVNRVIIEEGRIINVNINNWTVDVLTKNSQRQLIDLQWGNPYFHFAGGEGIYAMPEVGAIVQVCLPSDSAPFILCFVTTFEREATNTSDNDGSAQVGLQPDNSTAEDNPREITFRSGRPKLEQGDIILRTRDGNRVWLHRGGVVEVGSTLICRRFYIPLLNYIRDVCENYEMKSLAGEMAWHVSRSDQNPQGSAEALFTLSSRDYAQDEFASVMLRIGHVGDDNKLKLSIAPNKINAVTGEVSGDAAFDLVISNSGEITITSNSQTRTINGDLNETIDGAVTQDYSGDHQLTISGNQSVDIGGSHNLEATSSTERLSGGKTFDCQSLKVGAGAVHPMVIASPAFISYLLFHTHSTPSGTSGPPNGPPPTNLITSRKGRAE